MTQTAPADDLAALTRHIETRFHARHREQLPRLAALAEKVETVHFGDENVPEGLADLLQRMIGALEVHMKKEELILFPAIRRGGGAGIRASITVMRADHDDHHHEIAEICRLTAGLTLPEGACPTWTALYAGLEEFLVDLAEHIRLENDVLFPPFEKEAADV
ncbi:hemerythrin domain-containing protein [Phaeovulum sp. NW3]|uniref:hemerythrin domain-containing protein n=1 Tax=Phaeovulum sp. NW3 TaxID=2934933 RepID=UPI0020206883|nr:hemerythrin domain-containing protein [Phaeovulum sp. NW3]MCL7466562.1 hemerythrin domain-containing protein [Phaeovulum sp. NW3]